MFKHTASPSPLRRLLQWLGGLCVFAILHLCHWYLNGLNFDSESPNTISEPISLYLLLLFEVLSMTEFCTLSVDSSYHSGRRGGGFVFSLIVSQCMFVESYMLLFASKFTSLFPIGGWITGAGIAAAYILCLLWNTVVIPIAVFLACYIAGYDYWDARDLKLWGVMRLTGTSIRETIILCITHTSAWISLRYHRRQVSGSDRLELPSMNMENNMELDPDLESEGKSSTDIVGFYGS